MVSNSKIVNLQVEFFQHHEFPKSQVHRSQHLMDASHRSVPMPCQGMCLFRCEREVWVQFGFLDNLHFIEYI